MERHQGLLIFRVIPINNQRHSIDMPLKGIANENLQQLPRPPLA